MRATAIAFQSYANVHLCCGRQIRKGWTNVDCRDFGQEVTADLNRPWDWISDGSAETIYCKDGLEHLDSVCHFLEQCGRKLRVGGRVTVMVPHFRNPSAYRLTHKHLFSWSFWNVFPEAHDTVRNLRVVRNRLLIYGDWGVWRYMNALANLSPKWWERLLYASNVEVTLERIA